MQSLIDILEYILLKVSGRRFWQTEKIEENLGFTLFLISKLKGFEF